MTEQIAEEVEEMRTISMKASNDAERLTLCRRGHAETIRLVGDFGDGTKKRADIFVSALQAAIEKNQEVVDFQQALSGNPIRICFPVSSFRDVRVFFPLLKERAPGEECDFEEDDQDYLDLITVRQDKFMRALRQLLA